MMQIMLRERERKREREKRELPVQTADVHCGFERSVTCLYLENRCVKVCKYMYMYVRLCSQSLQCLVLIIGAVYWILDHSIGASQVI